MVPASQIWSKTRTKAQEKVNKEKTNKILRISASIKKDLSTNPSRHNYWYFKKSLFTRIFEKSHNREKTGKNHIFLENHRFWSAKRIPPKIIKNRLNFALSEKFTYIRNLDFWRKITIFYEILKKIKIFLVYFNN